MIKRINENLWFKQQQPLLKWMSNTDYGRDLLCIDKSFPKITSIAKNFIHSPGVTEFRVGAKWAKVIRHRWKEFQEYAGYFRVEKLPVLFPVVPQIGYAYTTSTFYPDPDPETTTVDGISFYDSTEDLWATVRGAAAGTSANDSASENTFLYIATGATSGKWVGLYRAFYLFDTSAIPDTDTISAATLSVYKTTNGSSQLTATNNKSAVVVLTTPAANTAIVAGDFDQQGTVAQSDVVDFMTPTSAYVDWTLNATGLSNISKTGVSKFGLRVENDRADSEDWEAASKINNPNAYYAEQAGTTNDPKLVVVHAGASTGRVRSLGLMGMGS